MSGTGSAERILAILDLFTEDRLEWSTEALMQRLGYARPTLYRYLKTLRESGFLTSLPNAGYTLGPRVTELDYLMRRSDPLIALGMPKLAELTQSHPCSAFLVRWYGRKLLCVASMTSCDKAKSSYPRGRPMPLARGAISRAILAWLPRRQQVPLIEENLSEFAAVGQGATVEAVLAELRHVRRDGYAVARGEVTPGVIGVAAAVLDAGRQPIAALCTTSVEADVDALRLSKTTKLVSALAGDLSARLALTYQPTDCPKPQERAL